MDSLADFGGGCKVSLQTNKEFRVYKKVALLSFSMSTAVTSVFFF